MHSNGATKWNQYGYFIFFHTAIITGLFYLLYNASDTTYGAVDYSLEILVLPLAMQGIIFGDIIENRILFLVLGAISYIGLYIWLPCKYYKIIKFFYERSLSDIKGDIYNSDFEAVKLLFLYLAVPIACLLPVYYFFTEVVQLLNIYLCIFSIIVLTLTMKPIKEDQ